MQGQDRRGLKRSQLLRTGLLAALLLAAPPGACAPGNGAPPEPAEASPVSARVLPGLEVLLRDSLHLVRDKRVGFLTNQTAVSSRGESGIDLRWCC